MSADSEGVFVSMGEDECNGIRLKALQELKTVKPVKPVKPQKPGMSEKPVPVPVPIPVGCTCAACTVKLCVYALRTNST
jgi:hypothetical protein